LFATATHLRAVPNPPSPPEELENLFRQHYDQVFRAAYRITGHAGDAEDVLQTVFLRLARRKGSLDLEPNPHSYLRRAAINAALDLVRARAGARQVDLEEVATEVADNPRLSPEARHADGELRRALRTAISKLNPNAAEMFVLRYFEGYDNREIASLLGTSHLVVGVTLHRTRGKLRKEIGEFF